jgi:hypothetical protein
MMFFFSFFKAHAKLKSNNQALNLKSRAHHNYHGILQALTLDTWLLVGPLTFFVAGNFYNFEIFKVSSIKLF